MKLDVSNYPGVSAPPSRNWRRVGVGSVSITERAKELVRMVLDSERVTAGPMMTRFENEIAEAHGCKYGLMCNSGTSALHIALAALREADGWQDGDEVLVPAITFVATSNVVLFNNLRPVFVDVEPAFYTLDPAEIERHITPRTRAIMPVHIGGLPCDMDPILEIARRHELRIVEDSAETMFARYKGRPVGSFGDIGCFSTYAAHVISTGVGGLCTTNDPELIVPLKSLMNHGRDAIYIRIDDDQKSSSRQLFEVVDRRFSFVRLGHSFRATEMEAALGVAEMEVRHERWAMRQRNADCLTEGLKEFEDVLQLPVHRPDCDHAFMFYPLVLKDGARIREELVLHLEERGVETRYLLPLINQPIYRQLFGDLEPDYPVASKINRDAFYIGCQTDSIDCMEYTVDCFREFFRGRRATSP